MEGVKGGGEKKAKYLVYGGVAGGIAHTCTAPLERLRLLHSVQHLDKRGPRYHGVLPALTKIWREEGFRGFYKGNGVNVLRILPTSAVRFYTFEVYKQLIMQWTGKKDMTVPIRLCSGSLAGATAVFVAFPLDLIRTRLAAPMHMDTRYKGLWHAVKTIHHEEGIRGFYKGIHLAMLAIAPYIAIYFTTYETLREHSQRWKLNRLKQQQEEEGETSTKVDTRPGVLLSLSMGATAATVAMTLTFPGDVLKRRMMVQGIGGEERQFNGLVDTIQKTWRNEGVKGFYRGIIPCYIRVIPSAAITWTVMELCKRIGGE
ncbi:Folate transporter 1, chloroplastic [Balamuthia mandrillaris]